MKTKLKYIIHILLLAAITSCIGNRKADEKPAPLYPQPQSVELNTKGGYVVNPISGKTINPIILGNGDTLVTGLPIPADGKTIHPDSIGQTEMIPYSPSDITSKARPNVHQIPNELTVIAVNKDSLTTIPIVEITENDTLHYVFNSIGDTIKTGVPIPVKGNKISAIQPQPKPALSPRFTDAAIYNMQYLDVDQGLASPYILDILQDKSGNLWFATNGGGVSKYNGGSFSHYTEKEGLSHNVVFSILEDKNGNLWFATNGGGVSKYDGESFTHYTEKEGLSNNIVWSILEDKNGNLWFATYGGGVCKYNGESFTHFTYNEGLSSNYVRSILEDKSGNLWFATSGRGVSKYNGENFTHFTEKEGLSDNTVRSILEDKNGNLWFATYGGGVCKYNGESFTHFTEKEGLSSNYVESILEDKSGNLWFATDGGGVSKYNGESFIHFTEKEGLINNVVWSIIEDNSGNLWFGTFGGGVCKYSGKSFTHYTEKEGLSNDVVVSILEDKKGDLWFGTFGFGVSNYDGESFTNLIGNGKRRDIIVLDILEDKSGNLWFATSGVGVLKFNGENFIQYSDKAGLSNNTVWSILEDKSGNLWFATAGGGVSKYNGEHFTHFTEREGLSNNYVRSILEDKSGNLWFATEGGGASKYDGKSFTHFTEKEGLGSNNLLSIFEDNSGNLWFTTDGSGVSKYNGKSFTYFTEKEGLSNNIIWSILEDKSGNLWLSSENGLTVMSSSYSQKNSDSEKEQNVFLKTFGKEDGLKGMDFYFNSACIDSKNCAWWGSGKSLTMLDMNEFTMAQTPPVIALRHLEINEQFVDYRNIIDSLGEEIEFNGVQQFENYPLNLELPYDKNHLTFHFAAIDWSAPHKIQYSYIMEGLNTSWSQPTTETKADYRNLPYGTYTFKACAIGESGEWSEAFEYEFTIHPPWWHTWWARTGYGLVFLLLIFGTVRLRTAKLKQRQKELEKEVDIATKEIREQKNEAERQRLLVEEAHREITDSINYAERIQRSFLATEELLNTHLGDHFVYFNPKEAVSGDFYWAGELANGNFAVSCADSTGHGVPGAIMSILNISSIEKAVEQGKTNPADIFNETRKLIIERLKKDGSAEGGKDGMDASLITLNPEKTKMTYVAANNPIWIIRNGELIEIKAEKMPVGKHDLDSNPFVGGEIELQKGDIIYTMTDGFQDQFGGEKGKKFKVKPMKQMLLEMTEVSMKEQHQKIAVIFENWKGSLEQVDDVCIVGVRI